MGREGGQRKSSGESTETFQGASDTRVRVGNRVRAQHVHGDDHVRQVGGLRLRGVRGAAVEKPADTDPVQEHAGEDKQVRQVPADREHGGQRQAARVQVQWHRQPVDGGVDRI